MSQRFAPALALALLVASLGGCMAEKEELMVRRAGGKLRIRYERSSQVIVARTEKVQMRECAVYAVDAAPSIGGSSALWRITTVDMRSGAEEIVYGIVPPGFAQDVPPAGPPPALQPGTTYRAECIGERRRLDVTFRMPAKDSPERDLSR